MRQTINPVHIATAAIHAQAALEPEKWATIEVAGELCPRCATPLDPSAVVTLSFGDFCAGCAEIMSRCGDCGEHCPNGLGLRPYGRTFVGVMDAVCTSCDERGE